MSTWYIWDKLRIRCEESTWHKKSGSSGLAIVDQINVLDFFSTGADDGVHHQVEEDTQDAPEISNKVVFFQLTYVVFNNSILLLIYVCY